MAPLPLAAPLKVRFIAGSFFSYGDQAPQPCRSLMRAKIFSGGALMLAVRSTRNASGLVAARARTPAMLMTTSTPTTATMVLIIVPPKIWRRNWRRRARSDRFPADRGSGRRFLGIDHPGRAELIDQHAEAMRPESLLDRHMHRALLRQCMEHPLRLRRLGNIERDRHALHRLIV